MPQSLNPQIAFTPSSTGHTFSSMEKRMDGSGQLDLETAVHDHYKAVYRFAYNLAKNPSDAADLTQYAYERLAMKWQQIQDLSKVKGWLQSTLYRKFLDQRRRVTRFPEVELDEDHGRSDEGHNTGDRIDAKAAVDAMFELEEELRAPLALFYLDSHPYKEIARMLDLPVGTVMSRLHRGKAKLFKLLTSPAK